MAPQRTCSTCGALVSRGGGKRSRLTASHYVKAVLCDGSDTPFDEQTERAAADISALRAETLKIRDAWQAKGDEASIATAQRLTEALDCDAEHRLRLARGPWPSKLIVIDWMALRGAKSAKPDHRLPLEEARAFIERAS